MHLENLLLLYAIIIVRWYGCQLYFWLKTIDTTSKFNFNSTFIASLEIEPFLKPWISNEILHQIQRSWAVLMII